MTENIIVDEFDFEKINLDGNLVPIRPDNDKSVVRDGNTLYIRSEPIPYCAELWGKIEN